MLEVEYPSDVPQTLGLSIVAGIFDLQRTAFPGGLTLSASRLPNSRRARPR